MYFKQITVKGMGCLSYIIGCPQAKVACVVDPKRDVQIYLELARQNGMKITHSTTWNRITPAGYPHFIKEIRTSNFISPKKGRRCSRHSAALIQMFIS